MRWLLVLVFLLVCAAPAQAASSSPTENLRDSAMHVCLFVLAILYILSIAKLCGNRAARPST